MSSLLASSMATPTICSPCDPYCFWKSTNQGISILQGEHQVAQKFNSTALPRKSERWTVLLSRDCKANSGAVWPLISKDAVADPGPARRAVWIPINNISATTTATTTMMSGFRFTDQYPYNNAKRFRND